MTAAVIQPSRSIMSHRLNSILLKKFVMDFVNKVDMTQCDLY